MSSPDLSASHSMMESVSYLSTDSGMRRYCMLFGMSMTLKILDVPMTGMATSLDPEEWPSQS